MSRVATPLAVGLLLAVSLQQLSAQAGGPDLSRPIPADPHVVTGTLANGLHYYIRVNHEPQHRAELRLAVNAGSVLEDGDQRGLAHLVEHMAFNGTTHFKRTDLVSYLESIGLRMGADLNAGTSFDETVYELTVPTDTMRLLDRAFLVMEDWAHGLVFDSAEVDRERGVVTEEWRLGLGAGARIRDKQFPVLFHNSRYAERLPIGTLESLQHASRAALVRFYRDWYRPDLMAVVAIGDFDAKQVEDMIRRHFAGIPRATNPRPRTVFPVPDHDSTLVTIVTDPEATNSSVSVYYLQPVRPERTVGDYRRALVERLYNGMLNNRFGEITQKPGAPFIGATSAQGRFVRSAEVYFLSAGVRDSGIPRGLAAVVTEAERVRRHGFTATELDRQKTRILRSLESDNAERDKTNSGVYAGEYVDWFLEGDPEPGIAQEYAWAQQLLPGITLAEVNALAAEWMVDKNRVIAASEPDKPGVPVPTEAQLLAVFDSVHAAPVAPYEDVATDRPLVADVPAPAAITAERTLPDLGVTEWRLANGVRVILKPTDFKADEIVFTAFSPGGTSLAPDSTYVSASLATAVMGRSGVGAFDQITLQKMLAGKEVSVRPTISTLYEGVTGAASPKDLETAFQLIYLDFTAPREDSSAFAALEQQFGAVLENMGASPRVAFSDTLEVTVANHHFRARPISVVFPELKLDPAYRFYRDRFADASDFTFVFVGSFSLDSIRPLVQRYLGGLPSLGRHENWKDEGVRSPPGVVEREVHKGIAPQSQTVIVFNGPAENTRRYRYEIGALGEVLSMRLRERMREDLSGTYSVGANGGVSGEPTPQYSFEISFGSAPERVNELTHVVFDEIRVLSDSGPADSVVAKVQEAERRSHETNLRVNAYWLGQLASAFRTGDDPEQMLTYDTLVNGLTAAAIRDAARRYLTPGHYVRVSLFPEARRP